VTHSSRPGSAPQPFSKFLSLLALLAIALYFLGWIYRWAYYDFFHIEVNTLNLPFESFYLAAFQVLFASPVTVLRTIAVVICTGLAILASLKIRQGATDGLLNQSPLFRNFQPSPQVKFLTVLIDEIIIIVLILTALFWQARWQAEEDAWQDAVNATSSLPVITVVIPEEGARLGRQLDNPLIDPDPSELRIIGDRGWYEQLLGQELSNTDNPDQLRVWRLLLDREGYFYIFPAPPQKDRTLSFPVLIVYENRNQLVILSPHRSE
jgi:hypothetical protein